MGNFTPNWNPGRMNNKLSHFLLMGRLGRVKSRAEKHRREEEETGRRSRTAPTTQLGPLVGPGTIPSILSQISFEIHPARWGCGKLFSIGSGGEGRQSGFDLFRPIRVSTWAHRYVLPLWTVLFVSNCSASVIWRNGLKEIELGVAFCVLESGKLPLLMFNRLIVIVEISLASRMCLG